MTRDESGILTTAARNVRLAAVALERALKRQDESAVRTAARELEGWCNFAKSVIATCGVGSGY